VRHTSNTGKQDAGMTYPDPGNQKGYLTAAVGAGSTIATAVKLCSLAKRSFLVGVCSCHLHGE
jgi:hypothetical protein